MWIIIYCRVTLVDEFNDSLNYWLTSACPFHLDGSVRNGRISIFSFNSGAYRCWVAPRPHRAHTFWISRGTGCMGENSTIMKFLWVRFNVCINLVWERKCGNKCCRSVKGCKSKIVLLSDPCKFWKADTFASETVFSRKKSTKLENIYESIKIEKSEFWKLCFLHYQHFKNRPSQSKLCFIDIRYVMLFQL